MSLQTRRQVDNEIKTGYYADGSRMWKKVGSAAPTYYLNVGGAIPVCQFDGGGNITVVHNTGANGLLSTAEKNGSGWFSSYYAFDFRGNTVNLLDGSGAVYANTTYKAYNSRNADHTYGPGFDGMGGQFGYYRDSDSLYLCGQRYYAPNEGRWLSRDPIGYAGGINLYSYAGNNPINYVDPSGLDVSIGEIFGQLGSGDTWRYGIATSGYALGNLVTLGNAFGEHANRPGFRASQFAWGGAALAGGGAAAFAAAPIIASNPLYISWAAGGGGAGATAATAGAQNNQAAAQVVQNGIRGRAFETMVRAALSLARGNAVQGRALSGNTVTTIPDSLDGAVWEIKDVASLSFTRQLQAQINYAQTNGLNYRLIVNRSTTISGPLLRAIQRVGGTIQRFDGGSLHPYP